MGGSGALASWVLVSASANCTPVESNPLPGLGLLSCKTAAVADADVREDVPDDRPRENSPERTSLAPEGRALARSERVIGAADCDRMANVASAIQAPKNFHPPQFTAQCPQKATQNRTKPLIVAGMPPIAVLSLKPQTVCSGYLLGREGRC